MISYEDLATSGYESKLKYKSLIILSYIWLCTKKQMQESNDFY
jgi:hypothetical protein